MTTQPSARSVLRVLRGSVQRSAALLAIVAAVNVPLAAQQPIVKESGSGDSRPTVAVLYFSNGALLGNADYAPLSKGMAEMMITELSRNPAIRVVERDRLQQLLAEQNLGSSDRVDKETALRLGKLLGAHHMLMGSFVIDLKQNMRLDVRSVNTETSAIEYVETVSGKSEKMLNMVEELGTKINAGLKLPQLPARVPSVGANAPTGPTQLRAMMLMSRALEQQDKGNIEGAKTLYRNALEIYPEFGRAKVLLASLETGRSGGGAQTH
jgi:curli biogenesis system outer membrane secretion channel CsgG